MLLELHWPARAGGLGPSPWPARARTWTKDGRGDRIKAVLYLEVDTEDQELVESFGPLLVEGEAGPERPSGRVSPHLRRGKFVRTWHAYVDVVETDGSHTELYLADLLAEARPEERVWHLDGDTLNCHRRNLYLVRDAERLLYQRGQPPVAALIPLRGAEAGSGFAKVSLEDFLRLKAREWWLGHEHPTRRPCAYTEVGRPPRPDDSRYNVSPEGTVTEFVRMDHLLTGAGPIDLVEHMNGDPLDYTRENLRPVKDDRRVG